MEKLNEKEVLFLIGLEKLTRDTGIEIAGCGCCSSPFLDEAKITSKDSGYSCENSGRVIWIDPSDEYDWEEFSGSIVKEANAHPQTPCLTCYNMGVHKEMFFCTHCGRDLREDPK